MSEKRGYYDVFINTCAKYPSNIGVRLYDNGVYKNYTYSELYGVCEYISQNLQQMKHNKGIIGIVSKINIVVPCIIAAAHKCCTTFMFVDPSQDIESIHKHVGFTIIVTIQDNTENDTTTGLFGKRPDRIIPVFDLTLHFYNCHNTSSLKSDHELHTFIAMTSGSTGEPKHIQVPVQCMQPNIKDLTKMFNVTSKDIVYFSTPLTFDPSMVDILLACSNGASLLIAPDRPEVLFPENRENSITIWQTTPSKFLQHSNSNIKNRILCENSTLRILALGGEPLNSISRLKELKDSMNTTKIFTLYGVTEMSCWACIAELDLNKISTDREIPLGNCLSETQIQIGNGKDNKREGNIVLVSKTRKCVILNKTKGDNEENSLKFIDTGDIGEVTSGVIYYRGRKDDIIKRFGNKVNLQHIENTVMQCPRVKTCSCIWLPKPMLLVVYFSSETFTSQELSDFLKCKLDDKHWPDKIMRVDNLPTNPHGKISKVILSKMYEKAAEGPQNIDSLKVMLLQELKSTLTQNFKYDDIKAKDFFSIGGTSFLAVTLANRLSLISSEFGQFILPYLVSQKYCIDEIIQLAYKEMKTSTMKPNQSLKRRRTISAHSAVTSSKRNTSINCVEFLTMWSYDTGKCVDASPTLFQAGFHLYVTVGSHSGKVVILNAASGQLQGVISLQSRIEASVMCFQEDPGIPACGVVGAYDGSVVCFALESCEEIWKINIGSMVKSKVVVFNGQLFVAAYDGNVRCIDSKTGHIITTINISEQGISADLVLARNEYVLVGGLSGTIASIHIPTKSVAWRSTVGSPVFASPAVYDDDKYALFAEVSGTIHCRTVEKGIKIWKYQGAKGNIFSSLFLTKTHKSNWRMIFGCHDKNVYCVNIKNTSPSLLWKTTLQSEVYSTPCSLDDKLILAASNTGVLCVIDKEQGAIVNELFLPNETFSTPAVHTNYIFIGCRNDQLYCIKCVINYE